MSSIIASLLGCLIGVALIATNPSQALLLSSKNFGPYLTLTYVHGGSDALMSHAEARGFCMALLHNHRRLLIKQQLTKTNNTAITNSSSTNQTITASSNNSSTIDQTNSTATNDASNATTTAPITDSEDYHDLLSLHDPDVIPGLMRWVLGLEKHQFWIGGRVAKTLHPHFGLGNRPHLLQMWTDGTPAAFRFLGSAEAELDDMAVNEVRCLSVDYASGRWAVHPCHQRMYFICETVHLPIPQSESTQAPSNANTTTEQSTTATTPSVLSVDTNEVGSTNSSSESSNTSTDSSTTAIPGYQSDNSNVESSEAEELEEEEEEHEEEEPRFLHFR